VPVKTLDEKTDSLSLAGVLGIIAGLLLLASGVTSSSLLLTGLGYVDKYLGSSITTEGDFFLQLAVAMLTFVVGLGGILVVAGGMLLLLNHRFVGRLLLGLGGGMAILGLLFSMAEALYVTGFSAPVFHQSYITLYWFGAVLATTSILLSRRAQHQ